MGSIVPPMGQRPACAQVYILDGEAQVAARRGLPWGSRLDAEIVKSLTDMLMAVNPFVKHFRSAADDDVPELHLRIMSGIILTIFCVLTTHYMCHIVYFHTSCRATKV